MITLERAQRDGIRCFRHLPQFHHERSKFVKELELLWRDGHDGGACLGPKSELLWFQDACRMQVATSWRGRELFADIAVAVRIPTSVLPEMRQRYALYQQIPWLEFVQRLMEDWVDQLDMSQGEIVGWWGECRFEAMLMRSLGDIVDNDE
jgi:hypothetical protein